MLNNYAKRVCLLSAIIMLHACCSYAQSQAIKPGFIERCIQTKNYYLLTLLQRDKDAVKLLGSDTALAGVTQRKLVSLNKAITECKNASCYPEQIWFSDDEIELVSGRLMAIYKPGNVLHRLARALVKSGAYSLYKNITPAELLIKAWEQDAAGLNYAIDVYAKGKKPNYPLIDSISYNVNAKNYTILMYDCAVTLYGEVKKTDLFFEPALNAALLYLRINERNDPANYEPMALTVNKAAVDKIKTIKWASYAYADILIPGAGPDNLTSPLSGEGMLRCRLAARQFRLGRAPLIMVTGGNVHPYKTRYNEAGEMKKYLVQELGIPENSVIVEPHARHTTTNMRNCARLIYNYGIPADKPGVVISDKSQIDFLMGMAGRCEKELKYVPYKLAKRISETAVEYYPVIESRAINPFEPLDP